MALESLIVELDVRPSPFDKGSKERYQDQVAAASEAKNLFAQYLDKKELELQYFKDQSYLPVVIIYGEHPVIASLVKDLEKEVFVKSFSYGDSVNLINS